MFKFVVNQELCCLFNILLIILSQKDSAPFEHALKAFCFPVCSAISTSRTGEKEACPSACSPACHGCWNRAGPVLLSVCPTSPRWGQMERLYWKPPRVLVAMAAGGGMARSPLRGHWRWLREESGQASAGCSFGSDSLLAAVLSQYLLLGFSYLYINSYNIPSALMNLIHKAHALEMVSSIS